MLLTVKYFFSLVQWVLSSKEINFPYPVALTLLHMVFSSVVCFAITKVFKVIIRVQYSGTQFACCITSYRCNTQSLPVVPFVALGIL